MRKWKLAFMASLSYSQLPPEQVVASLKALGYEGVEWTSSHFDPRAKSLADLRRLVEITAEGGLVTSEVCAQQDLVVCDDRVRGERIAQALEAIQAAGEVGVKAINLFTGPRPWVAGTPVVGRDVSLATAWDMVHQGYDLWAPAAEKAGVRIAVEGVWGMVCHDLYTTLPLIERYRSPNLGVNFDPSHDVLVGNTDSGDIVKVWGKERIHHVHLKDAVGIAEAGKFVFPLLGEGVVPWSAFFGALDDIGYEGCCSVEFESFSYYREILRGDGEEAARLSIMQVRRLLGEE